MNHIQYTNIQDAATAFNVQGLDCSMIENQQDAYEVCLEFLKGLVPIKSLNRRHTSYGLKHIVENPAGRMGVPSDSDCYSLYVYEGTFILAALSSGFQMKQFRGGLTAIFNISEKSLKQRALEISKIRTAGKD